MILELYEDERETDELFSHLDGKEFIQKWISFIGLVSEAIFSNKTEIGFANCIGLKTK